MTEGIVPAGRVIEESVPGKQVTIAHVIASPVPEIYECLGIEGRGAIGILTLSPFETAMIAADIAAKASDVEIGFLDRFYRFCSDFRRCGKRRYGPQGCDGYAETGAGFAAAEITRT